MKKNLVRATFLLLILSVFVGCATYVPYAASVSYPADGDYEILGRVNYEGVVGEASYQKLLDSAKKQYPGTDDVVNIIVDAKRTSYLITYQDSFTMSGIAIKYIK